MLLHSQVTLKFAKILWGGLIKGEVVEVDDQGVGYVTKEFLASKVRLTSDVRGSGQWHSLIMRLRYSSCMEVILATPSPRPRHQ